MRYTPMNPEEDSGSYQCKIFFMGEKEENQSYKVANVTLIFQTESKVDSGNYMPGNLPFSITSQQINSQQHSRLITE